MLNAQFIICKVSVDAFSSIYYKLRRANLLAYVAALFVASVNKLPRALGADARTGDSKSSGRRFEFASV